jgi:dynein heavy chain 1
MVMDALKNAKRFHATVSFIAEPGLKDATDLGGSRILWSGLDLPLCSRLTMGTVHKYNQLMNDFLLNNLLFSTDLDTVYESLTLISSHLNRKLNLSLYPIYRALPLVEANSQRYPS